MKVKPTCYVCSHTITGEAVYIGGGLYRHIRCAPGTEKWLQSDWAKVSPIAEHYLAARAEAKRAAR